MMKTIGQLLKGQEAIILEMEQFFKIQEQYFADRTESNLQKLRVQTSKIKQMIADNKKPIHSLR